MGLEQYAGMTTDEKVMALLVKMDNLEQFILTRPCPSAECKECRKDVQELKVWKAKREAEIGSEANDAAGHETRNAWFWPMIAVICIAAIDILTMFWGN